MNCFKILANIGIEVPESVEGGKIPDETAFDNLVLDCYFGSYKINVCHTIL